MATKIKLERIVGVVGFLDSALSNIDPSQANQYDGLFRVSPGEDDYRAFQERLAKYESVETMRNALEMENPEVAIICSAKLLKSLVNSLDKPLISLNFALETFDAGDETDKSTIGAMLAESLLRSLARTHPGEDCASFVATTAQLLALLCHTSRRPITKMTEYNLCVVFLPALSLTRSIKPEELMAEQQQLKAFQTGHREGSVPARLEMFIQYGRRIWGAVYDVLDTLQPMLNEMSKENSKPGHHHAPGRKRDVFYKFLERAAQPITHRLRPSDAGELNSHRSTAPNVKNDALRRPSLLTRAMSHSVYRKPPPPPVPGAVGDMAVAAEPGSSLNETFLNIPTNGGDSSFVEKQTILPHSTNRMRTKASSAPRGPPPPPPPPPALSASSASTGAADRFQVRRSSRSDGPQSSLPLPPQPQALRTFSSSSRNEDVPNMESLRLDATTSSNLVDRSTFSSLRWADSSNLTLDPSTVSNNGGFLPTSSSSLTTSASRMITPRSSSTGSVSNVVKAAAHNSAMKRRMSREGEKLPAPSLRQGSSGSFPGDFTSSPEGPPRPTGSNRRMDYALTRSGSGSSRRSGGSNSGGIILSNSMSMMMASSEGEEEKSEKPLPPPVPAKMMRERQLSVGDVGRQMLQENLQATSLTRSPLKESDSDLL